MEARLKGDILIEALRFGNRILVAGEDDDMQVCGWDTWVRINLRV